MGKTSRLLWLGFIGVFLISAIILTLYIHSLPSLSTWHTTVLKNEFTADSGINDFKAYLALEDRLFRELDHKIYARLSPAEKSPINRYTEGSLSDPKRWERNWNRSFELPVKHPKMGILLLHGMSDSPYSLRAQAELLQKKGVWVVAMRLPGHGTVPSGLIDLKWQDMAAAVKIGMRRLHQKVGDKPIHIMGYSTGALLALNYTLAARHDPALVLPSKLIFFSPAIGVSKAAPLAVWQSRLGHLLGIPELEWNALSPEYDPFKYGSFAVNAADQVYRLSQAVQKQLDAYLIDEKKRPFPPVLSFASIVDYTVSVSDTIQNLYERLPKGDHTLYLFDINHDYDSLHLVKHTVTASLQRLREMPGDGNYTFDLISNKDSKEKTLLQITDHNTVEDLHIHWPRYLYSLSHVAMPIGRNDPLYGDADAPKSPGIQLGHLALYGETDVLQIPASAILRQRWNPFYDYINQKTLAFIGLQ